MGRIVAIAGGDLSSTSIPNANAYSIQYINDISS